MLKLPDYKTIKEKTSRLPHGIVCRILRGFVKKKIAFNVTLSYACV